MTKTALLTGATSGIGYELSQLLAADRYDLILVARNQAKLSEMAEGLAKQNGVRVTVLSKDLTDPKAPDEIALELKSKGIEPEILVNNAGYGLFGDFSQTDTKKEFEMIQLNVVALTRLTKLFLPGMIARKSGKILNVASTAAFQPGPLMAVYYATKAYVLSFSEAIAEELVGTGVSVTALCPGPTETGFQSQAEMEGSKLIRGKIATAAEVARAGYDGLVRGKRVVIVGLKNTLLANSVRFMPRTFVAKLVKKAQEREGAQKN